MYKKRIEYIKIITPLIMLSGTIFVVNMYLLILC